MSAISEYLRTAREIWSHPLERHAPVKAVLRYLGWNIGRRLVSADFVLPFTDRASLVLSNAENYATLAYVHQLWDFEEMVFLLHLLRPGDTFFDIGSNVGGYSILASAVAGARSVAIEPVPDTYRRLLRNIRHNDIATLVDPHNVGLAQQPGTLRFTAGRGGLNHVDSSGEIEVEVRTLDDMTQAAMPRALKIDVEGYELSVLRGAPNTLGNPALQAIVIELNGTGARYGHSDNDVRQQLRDHGFHLCEYDPFRREIRSSQGAANKMNELYCRGDLEALSRHVQSAAPVNVRGISI